MSWIDTVDWADEVPRRAETGALARDTEDRVVELALDAVAMVRDAVPTVEARLTAGQLTRRTFCRVISDMVLRVVRNPQGFKSESDSSYSYTSGATVASGDLWIPDKDLALLRGVQSSGVPSSTLVGVDPGWVR